MAVPRSYLYVPGDQPDKLERARDRGADALVVDLEDAVVPARKERARDVVREWLGRGAGAGAELGDGDGDDPPGPEVWVRVNPDSLGDDLAAVVLPGLAGVVVPKAEPALLLAVDRLLTARERAAGLPVGGTAVLALVETARGVLRAEEVAASPRVVRLGLGEADLVGELGLRPGPERAELLPLRMAVVLASAVAGVLPPVGPVELALADPVRLERTTRELLRQGFRARTALAPRQVEVVNAVFTPTEDELADARRVLRLLEQSRSTGTGVAVDEDGSFIDAATARSAHEVVARAR